MSGSKKLFFWMLSLAFLGLLVEGVARTIFYHRIGPAKPAVVYLVERAVLNLSLPEIHASVDDVKTDDASEESDRAGEATERQPWHEFVYLPEDIRQELIAVNAVLSNAGNPTGARPHDTILVEPDDELVFKLRPNVDVQGWFLDAVNSLNLDPPSLHIPTGTTLSDRLSTYIQDMERARFRYTTNDDGLRHTFPEVDGVPSVVVLGDSVGFGVGVDDEDTIASKLQTLVGSSHRIINASVGGYQPHNILAMARRMARSGPHSAMIYIACENDFPDAASLSVFEGLQSLASEYNNTLIVAYVPYMEHVIDDVLMKFSPQRMKRLRRLRKEVAAEVARLNLPFIDFMDIAEDYAGRTNSVYSRFALYVDHTHLSPEAAGLVAERLHREVAAAGLL